MHQKFWTGTKESIKVQDIITFIIKCGIVHVCAGFCVVETLAVVNHLGTTYIERKDSADPFSTGTNIGQRRRSVKDVEHTVTRDVWSSSKETLHDYSPKQLGLRAETKSAVVLVASSYGLMTI